MTEYRPLYHTTMSSDKSRINETLPPNKQNILHSVSYYKCYKSKVLKSIRRRVIPDRNTNKHKNRQFMLVHEDGKKIQPGNANENCKKVSGKCLGSSTQKSSSDVILMTGKGHKRQKYKEQRERPPRQ